MSLLVFFVKELCGLDELITNWTRGAVTVDLDSFASALLYAYLSSPGPTQSQQSTILPILPIPRADLNLRPEFIYLLRELKIPKQDLIFIDDIPTPILTGAGGSTSAKNEVVLVDHNTLQEKVFPPTRMVVRGVIDHHKDERKYLDADPRIIEVSGSCASLVTNWGNSKWGDWGSGPGVKEAAKLALAPILIDTGNMKMRVTPHDRSAVKFLESKLGGGGVGVIGDGEGEASAKQPWNSNNFFLKLSEAKSSLDSLSTYDILRKDFKSFTTTCPPDTNQDTPGRITPTLTLGISSVVKPLSYLTSSSRGGPEAFLSALSRFAQERNLDVAAVMPSFTNEATGGFSRELLVWEISEEAHRAEYMKQFVKWAESKEGAMGLQPLGAEEGAEEGLRGLEDGEGRRRVWSQGNTAMSRKQVAPGMRGCL